MTQNQIRAQELAETERHNRTSELFTASGLTETQRHNVATEGISTRTVDESIRHNTVSEGTAFANLREIAKHNRATEIESQRHNTASESIAYGELGVHRAAQRATQEHYWNQDSVALFSASKTAAYNRDKLLLDWEKYATDKSINTAQLQLSENQFEYHKSNEDLKRLYEGINTSVNVLNTAAGIGFKTALAVK